MILKGREVFWMSSEIINAAAPKKKKRKLTMPHIYLLLFMFACVCAIASWIIPAGVFDRVQNSAGKGVVIPGTYHTVASTPVTLFQLISSIYKGMLDAGNIIFFVFMAYASIGLIISTGAFNGLVAKLLKKVHGKYRTIIIPAFLLIIGIASSTIGCFEEMYPFIPIFVGITIAMGYDAIVGAGIVALATSIGYSAAFMNPFNVGMAQSIAGITQMSGAGFRIFSHLVMITVASIYMIRYALKVEADPSKSVVHGISFSNLEMDKEDLENHPFGIREKLVLLTLAAGIAVIVWGCKTRGWYFEELCTAFLTMGVISAIIMGWGPNIICGKMANSFSEIAMACIMIGVARAILVVLNEGNIIDTVVYGLSIPLSYMPKWIAGEAMLVFQTLLNFLIPSSTGMAVVSMPIMAPLSDLLGIPRQVAVLAFQFGDGLTNVLWPTASTPVICAIAGIPLQKWMKWFTPLFLLLLLTEAVLIAISIAIGYV
jgi:uncharacterized ion transporter superfamily protein YfcC